MHSNIHPTCSRNKTNTKKKHIFEFAIIHICRVAGNIQSVLNVFFILRFYDGIVECWCTRTWNFTKRHNIIIINDKTNVAIFEVWWCEKMAKWRTASTNIATIANKMKTSLQGTVDSTNMAAAASFRNTLLLLATK